MAAETKSFWKRHTWLRWLIGGLFAVLLAVAGIAAYLAHRAEPWLRARIVQGLEQRFHARVELDTFHIALGNQLRGQWGIWAEGRGLRIWPSDKSEEALGVDEHAQAEFVARDEPLIRVDEFGFHAPLRYTPGKPLVISDARVDGLDILVPPRMHADPASPNANPPQPNPAPPPIPDAGATPIPTSTEAGLLSNVLIERVECDHANLVLETSKPGKLPLGFAIARLVLTGFTFHSPIAFEADLTNPRPLGDIHTTGSFGPWITDDPAASAVTGDYRFDHADLSSFKEIAGILNSTGHYQGTLRNILVDGVTDTPDFQLTHFGNSVPLHTRFHATVDGTDGDTWLDPVDATLGQSHFTARGQVVRFKTANEQPASAKPLAGKAVSTARQLSALQGGHDIAFTINIDRGRIEDFLRLASHSPSPLLTGAVSVKAKLHIPPGPVPLHERLQLAGNFVLGNAVFTSPKIQDRIEELSLRGQGRPKDVKTTDPSTIDSTMQSDFTMAGGFVTLPNLNYTVPGATIQLKGTYGVDGGALDFVGVAKLQATVSQIVGGWKGLLLKPADRFFKKDGAGAEVPISIDGTREDPKFGLDFDRFKSTSPQKPGANN